MLYLPVDNRTNNKRKDEKSGEQFGWLISIASFDFMKLRNNERHNVCGIWRNLITIGFRFWQKISSLSLIWFKSWTNAIMFIINIDFGNSLLYCMDYSGAWLGFRLALIFFVWGYRYQIVEILFSMTNMTNFTFQLSSN